MKLKLIYWLLPAAALIAASLWISAQRRDLSAIESENQRIAAHLAHARSDSSSSPDPSQATRSRATPFHNAKGIDWKKIAAAQAAMQSSKGMPDMRTMVELQKTLRSLSTQEILAGLDEIQALEISSAVKEQLEGTLLSTLIAKDPQAALQYFGPRLRDGGGGINRELAQALKQWSAKDPIAAGAWLDQQIANGSFTSKSLNGNNHTRHMFEASLIHSLLVSDPAAAAARLTAIPEGQRDGIFGQSIFIRLKPGQVKPLADLIRSQLPEDLRTSTLADITSRSVHHGGFERISGILTEIHASREERKAIVSRALSSRLQNRADGTPSYQETRGWIHAAAPEDAAALTGQALANFSSSKNFDEMAAHALAEQQSSGNDQTLAAFLMEAPSSTQDQILKLAENLSDPAQRAAVEARFAKNPNRSGH